ncbi:MAG: nodulation protein NfeD [Clostridia bacterium]|nr:nodulation protein NfeD [Clostridia bacterium]
MKNTVKISVLFFVFFAFTISCFSAGSLLEIKIDKTIEPGLAAYISRSYETAEQEGYTGVLIVMDTPGGLVDASIDIKNTIIKSDLPTYTYIDGQAISAGSLIALSSEKIAMRAGSTMGAAEPRVGNEIADEKILSVWKEELASAAETYGRDPEIARAFADREMVIEGVKEQGKILSLSSTQAKDLGMVDFVVQSKEEFLTEIGLDNAEITESNLTIGERVARLLTNPFVAPILLTIGISGLILEVFSAGFGIFGILGGISLGLFFLGNIAAGFSNWIVVLVFLSGLILMAVEAFMPGFGIFGVSGLGLFILSIVLVSPSVEAALTSLTIAILMSIIIILIAFKFLKRSPVWNRLVLQRFGTGEEVEKENSASESVLGQEGVTLTALRPSGTVLLNNGEQLSVVSDGAFIEINQQVVVINREGNRILVRKIQK